MGIALFGRWLGRSGQSVTNTTNDEKTIEPTDAESQFDLARKLAGEGASQNLAQAAECYLKAANQGHSVAQFNLGMMYGQGQGVVRDQMTALMWLRKAAELGHATAQYHVGVRQHRASKGRPLAEASECRMEAFKWLELAVAQGHRGSAAALEFVALNMTREEVNEGGRRALTFAADRAKPGGNANYTIC